MKKLFKIKPLLWLVFAVIIGLSINFLITELRFNDDIKTAQAGDEHSLSGFAWNGMGPSICSNNSAPCNSDADCTAPAYCVKTGAGWISFNSNNCDLDGDGDSGPSAPAQCPAEGTLLNNHGVHINNGNGHFSGYAWSSTVGWIAFERARVCDNDTSIYCVDSQDCADAGVGGLCDTIDPDPVPYGYPITGCPDCTEGVHCTACLNMSDDNIYGWAKILSMGEDGWIRLDNGGGSYNGVSRNSDKLQGWAWNSSGICDDGPESDCDTDAQCIAMGGTECTKVGIGWISFNCNDIPKVCEPSTHPRSGEACEGHGVNPNRWCDSHCSGSGAECFNDDSCPGIETCDIGMPNNYSCEDFCTITPYDIILDLKPSSPFITNVDPLGSNFCEGLKVDWTQDSGSYQDGYNIYRAGFTGFTPDGTTRIFDLTDGGAVSYSDNTLNPAATWYYIVGAYDTTLGKESYSNEENGTTYSVCKVDTIISEGLCPLIRLSWAEETAAEYYNVKRCWVNGGTDCSNDVDFVEFALGDGCFEPNTNTCDDDTVITTPEPGQRFDEFYYKVQAVNTDTDPDEFGNWSDAVGPYRACTLFPTWREVR